MCYAQPGFGSDKDKKKEGSLEALSGRVLSVFDLRVEDDREMWSGKSMDELREADRMRGNGLYFLQVQTAT